MPGILYLSKHDPDQPIAIHVGRVGGVRDIATTARYAPALIADYQARRDVHRVRVVAAGKTTVFDGAAADQYRRTS